MLNEIEFEHDTRLSNSEIVYFNLTQELQKKDYSFLAPLLEQAITDNNYNNESNPATVTMVTIQNQTETQENTFLVYLAFMQATETNIESFFNDLTKRIQQANA